MSEDTPQTFGLKGLERTKALRESLQLPSVATKSERKTCPDPTKALFFSSSDEESVQMFGSAFEPELRQLQAAKATVEATNEKTKGNLILTVKDEKGRITKVVEGLTPSKLLFGKDYAEVNRSIVGVLALKWLVNNNYDAFVGPSELRSPVTLTRASFDELRQRFVTDLVTAEEYYALIVSTIVNDLGKDEDMVQEVIRDYLKEGDPYPNHDEVIFIAAQNKQVSLFEEFEPAEQLHADLILGLQFGARLNVAQFAQAENVPASLSAVQTMKNQPRAFSLKFLEIVLDVAGAQGHKNATCCLSMVEPIWRGFASSRDILSSILADDKDLREAYDEILTERAAVLTSAGYKSLSVKDPTERALLRLMCMGRATNAAKAGMIDKAMDSLSPDQCQALVDGLSVDGTTDGTAILPYYAPSLLANTLTAVSQLAEAKKLDSSAKETASINGIAAILRLLVRAYAGTKPRPHLNKGMVVECAVNFAQDIFDLPEDAAPEDRHCKFITQPQILDTWTIPSKAYSVPKAKWL